jgi:hypothetical protein
LRCVRRSELVKAVVLFDQPLVARAQPRYLGFESRQCDDRRGQAANTANARRDCALGNAKDRVRDRRDRASRARALRSDLKQREKPCDDDDANQREKFSFVSVREDDRSALRPSCGDGYFVTGSVNPNARNARTRRASGRPMTV